MIFRQSPTTTKMHTLKIVLGGAVLMGLNVGNRLLNLRPKRVKAVDEINVTKFSGRWYEIARKPVTIERKSFKNITTYYNVIDQDKLKVEWRYQTYEGRIGQLFGEAKVTNAPQNSKFKIGYLPEFLHALRAKSYMIIRIDPDYKIALIGNKQHSHLWLLSREAHLPENIREDYLTFAQQKGFKLDDLIYVEHD